MKVRTLPAKRFAFWLAICPNVFAGNPVSAQGNLTAPPAPLLQTGHPVDWWFVFKFNAASFPSCGGQQRDCVFGGDVQPYQSFSVSNTWSPATKIRR